MIPSLLDRFIAALPLRSGHRALAMQAVMFGLVGFVNLAVDFCVFLMAYAWLTHSLVVANVLAWIVAVTGSYVLNSRLTFARLSAGRLGLRDYATFAASQVGGLLANTATLVLAATVMPVVAAKVLATLAGFAVNFTLARLIVFRGGPARD